MFALSSAHYIAKLLDRIPAVRWRTSAFIPHHAAVDPFLAPLFVGEASIIIRDSKLKST
jgi:hypothetical protein